MTELPFLHTTVTLHLAQTAHLSAEAMGAYEVLRLHYWLKQGPLPDNQSKLAKLARTTPQQWRRVSDEVLSFFTLTPDGYRSSVLDAEITRALDRSKKASEKAYKKWHSTANAEEQHE